MTEVERVLRGFIYYVTADKSSYMNSGSYPKYSHPCIKTMFYAFENGGTLKNACTFRYILIA